MVALHKTLRPLLSNLTVPPQSILWGTFFMRPEDETQNSDLFFPASYIWEQTMTSEFSFFSDWNSLSGGNAKSLGVETHLVVGETISQLVGDHAHVIRTMPAKKKDPGHEEIWESLCLFWLSLSSFLISGVQRTQACTTNITKECRSLLMGWSLSQHTLGERQLQREAAIGREAVT